MVDKPALQPLENPWREQHNMEVTQATIKELLKDGTPDWVRFPKDYKEFAKETIAADKEISDTMAEEYKLPDQELLKDPARKRNRISTVDFVKKLSRNRVKCFCKETSFPPMTVALWAVHPETNELVYVSYMEVPAMWEWSFLLTDKRDLPAGEVRGWRTVLFQLIKTGILSEKQAHEIFGEPAQNEHSTLYRRDLYLLRNHQA